MATRYFKKELVKNRLNTQRGDAIPFEEVADQRGVRALDDEKDAYLIEQLRAALKRRIGGVVEIDEATYTELKKNSNGRKRYNPFEPKLKASPDLDEWLEPKSPAVKPPPIPNGKPSSAAAAVAERAASAARAAAEPKVPPSPRKSPIVRKVKEVMAAESATPAMADE